MGRFGFDVSDDERNVIERAIEVARVLNHDKMPRRYHGVALSIIAGEWMDTIEDDVIDEALSSGEIFEACYGDSELSERQSYHYKNVIRDELFMRLNGLDGIDSDADGEDDANEDEITAFRQALRVACNDAIEAGTAMKAFFADSIDEANRLSIFAFGKTFLEVSCGDMTGWVLLSGETGEVETIEFDKAMKQHKIDTDELTITELTVGGIESEKRLKLSTGAKCFVGSQEQD